MQSEHSFRCAKALQDQNMNEADALESSAKLIDKEYLLCLSFRKNAKSAVKF